MSKQLKYLTLGISLIVILGVFLGGINNILAIHFRINIFTFPFGLNVAKWIYSSVGFMSVILSMFVFYQIFIKKNLILD